AAGDAAFRDPFGPNLPGFVQVPFNDVGAMDAAIDDQTAGVLLEAIPATLGMPIPAPGYFSAIRKLCDDRGVMLLVDEVQT
ncbi:MAG: aminotransferase class III-fold pyridoxal phosphate-dependent enzyme, partial [Deltaproteobacteria bacterium]|nr:aminotransferase class III-fold pyridoxal phosphate-dependent enzyme [Deltaproteobacteria bacterium]